MRIRSLATPSALLALLSLPTTGTALGAVPGYYPGTVFQTPEANPAQSVVIGAPDDRYIGLGAQFVTYNLGGIRLINGPGPDINVYEADFGAVEFNLMDILVSMTGTEWFSLYPTIAPGVDLIGDQRHNSAAHFRSFDLAGSGLTEARFIRIKGLGTGPSSGTNGFDLDAVGLINWIVPAPAAPLTLSVFALVANRRRRS